MPEKVVAARRRSRRPARGTHFHRPSADAVQRAARAALRRPAVHGSSQRELLDRVLPLLRREDPLAALGGRRLRGLILELPGVRLDVTYREESSRRPVRECPVCTNAVRPIRNRTLEGDRVVLGYQCPRCGYWTHLRRRVPVRYSIRLGAPRLSAGAN